MKNQTARVMLMRPLHRANWNDSRVTHRRREEEIEPSPAKKEGRDRRDDHVVRGVSGGKRGSGFGLVGVIRIANGGLFEKRHELRTHPLELHHSGSLNLLWPPAIDRAFQRAHEQLLRGDQGDEQAKNKGAALESHENQRIQHQHDEDRLPDFHVADRSHEQVEGGSRPSFVNEMKNDLIHSLREL
jgi:hypothetical protein